jgi:hypothetical protein
MPRIHRLVRILDERLNGASQGCWGHISAALKDNRAHPYTVANEYICAELGHTLRLPIPPSGFVRENGHADEVWFASLNFTVDEEQPPPMFPDQFVAVAPNIASGIVLFDILIANSDRHSGNLSADLTRQPPLVTVFDHSHALFGSVANQGQTRLNLIGDTLGITGLPPTGGSRHCLLDHIQSDNDLGEWLHRIEQLPDYFIDDVCAQVEGIGVTKEETNAVQHFLKHRRDTLRALIKRNYSAFPRIQQWGLFL